MLESNASQVKDALTAIQIVERSLGIEDGRLQTVFMDGLTLEDRLESWDMITSFIDGIELPVADIGQVGGTDRGLFYRGYLNMVWGDDGHGKSLLIDQVTWVERHRGHKVMILEAEELNPRTRVARWLDESNDRTLVTVEDVAGVVVYPINRPLSVANIQMMATQVREQDVSVVFVDSLGTLMSNMGLNENEAKDVYTIKRLVFDPLTEAGAGVVVVDHVTKSEGEKPKSIGSTRKRNILSGVGYELRADGSRWSRRRSGHADLTCWKDRQGDMTPNEHVATLWVTPTVIGGYLQLTVEAPEELSDDEEQRPAQPPASKTDEQLVNEFEAIVKGQPRAGLRAIATLLNVETQAEVKRIAELGREQARFYRDKSSTWRVVTAESY